MPAAPIENETQYRAARERIAALEEHLRVIADLQRRAATHRHQNNIEDEDLRDLAPLEDAIADISYTREWLLEAVDTWQNLVETGHPCRNNTPRVVSIRTIST